MPAKTNSAKNQNETAPKTANSLLSPVCFAAITLFFLLALIAQSQLIPYVDNYFISMVSNGMYGKGAWCLFVNPVLNRIIEALALANPTIDWFTGVSRVISFAALAWVSFCLCRTTMSTPKLAGALLVLAFLVVDTQLFSSNFTVFSAFYAAVGWFSLSVYLRSTKESAPAAHRRGALAASALLFGGSLLFRWECAVLALPFIAIDLIPLAIKSRRIAVDREKASELSKGGKGGALIAALFSILIAIPLIADNAGDYQDAATYNSARSTLVDFPVKSFDEISPELPGLSENDYGLLLSWFFGDTEFFDTECMEEVAQAAKTTTADSLVSLPLAKIAAKNVLGYPVYLFLAAVVACCTFARGNATYRAKLIACICLSGCIFAYYSYVGRLPFRIIVSVYFFFFTFVLNNCTSEKSSGGERASAPEAKPKVFGALACICIACAAIWSLPTQIQNYRASRTDSDSLSAAYSVPAASDDYLVFWDSSSYIDRYMNAGIMPDQDYLDHNIPTGTWLYGQPYFNDFLAQHNAANPARSLLEREDTYFCAANPDRVLAFLREHYKQDAQVERVGTIGDQPVWRFF